jgi:hypothetical protein
VLDRLQHDLVPLEMTKIAFGSDVNVGELQDNAAKVLAFIVRERPPLLFGTFDRLIERLDTAELVTALRDRRSAIFAEREAIESAMERPDPPLVDWISP